MTNSITFFKKTVFLMAAALSTALFSYADVRLPKIFGSGMVLQRAQPIPVWGWADKGEKITVQFNGRQKTVKTGTDGRWKLFLNAENHGGPYQLIIKGKNTITFNDVWVGDVWVCSGQSNMEFVLNSAQNAEEEIKAANYPKIRHIKIPRAMAYQPENDLEQPAVWEAASPETAGRFTAVGYFFARKLQQELNIPIGLIHSSWGGTDIETWISRDALEKSNLFVSDEKLASHADLESLIRQRKEKTLKKIKETQGGFADAAAVSNWKSDTFDDNSWPQVKIPGLWEQSVENFDGIVWFRKTIHLSAAEAGKAAQLELARIDDSDDTYVNGARVGGMQNKYNDRRIYSIPAGLLKAGQNVISVRVEDTGGGGGIYGTPDEVKLTIGAKTYPLASAWRYQVEKVFDNSSANAGNPNDYPTLLYNAMINPLIGYAIKGVIWYQGENNAGRAYQYRTAFPLLINDWRKRWGQGDFPFYFVQLASWKAANGNSNSGSSWAELREAQAMTLALPNTGMAVTIDIGETGDIHPRNKQDVGKRLAAVALNKTYGKDNAFSGPVFDTMQLDGNRAVLSFKYAEKGLTAKDKYGYVRGFEIAGKDKKFYYAKAVIQGNKIIVSNESVPNPVAVRYAWADDAGDANLYNKEGFPAAPFRTDQWDGITKNAKYTVR